MNYKILFLCACLIVSTTLLAGCGDGRGARVPVTGTVSIDGSPLKFGSVTFLPVSNDGGPKRAGGGSLDESGRFQISSFTPNDGLMVGKYEVMVMGVEPVSSTSQKWHAPKKYSVAATSGLTAEVSADEEKNELKFELSWEGEKPSEPFVENF